MDKLKIIQQIGEVIRELHSYNKLTRWQKIQNWFRNKLGKTLIENLVINPEREKILKKKVEKLKSRLHG